MNHALMHRPQIYRSRELALSAPNSSQIAHQIAHAGIFALSPIRATVLLTVCLLLGVWNAYGSQLSPSDILKRSYAAESNTSYSGRLRTTLHLGSGQASADVNVFRSGRSSRLEYLTGPAAGVAIIDDGKAIVRLNKSEKTAVITRTPTPPENLALLLKNYRASLARSDQVAGRKCYVIHLIPNYSGNPSKKLWIDYSTFIPLKTERYDADGKLVMSTQFTSINLSARPPRSTFDVPDGWKIVELPGQPSVSNAQAASKVAGFSLLEPSYVPRGYVREGYFICETCPRACCAGVRYSNGLNTISIFQRKTQILGRGQGRGWRGGRGNGQGAGTGKCIVAENPEARMLQTAVNGLRVVLVGDISENELRKMAASLK